MRHIPENERLLGEFEDYFLHHPNEPVTVTFLENDTYLCSFLTNDWDDNGEELDSPDYEEWFTLIFRVKEILVLGPNKDPRFEFIQISEKVMPYKVQCGDTVLYEDGKLLI